MGFKNCISFATSDAYYRALFFLLFLVLHIKLMLYTLFALRRRKHTLMMYHLAFAVSCPIAMR